MFESLLVRLIISAVIVAVVGLVGFVLGLRRGSWVTAQMFIGGLEMQLDEMDEEEREKVTEALNKAARKAKQKGKGGIIVR